MSWKSLAEIQIRFDTEKKTEAIFCALKPEAKRSPTPRSKVEVSMNGNDLFLKIKAKDMIALRAAYNSHIRFLKAWKKVIQAIEPENFEKELYSLE